MAKRDGFSAFRTEAAARSVEACARAEGRAERDAQWLAALVAEWTPGHMVEPRQRQIALSSAARRMGLSDQFAALLSGEAPGSDSVSPTEPDRLAEAARAIEALQCPYQSRSQVARSDWKAGRDAALAAVRGVAGR